MFAATLFFLLSFQGDLTRSADLVWTDTVNPVGTTYNVYRAPNICDATVLFAKIAVNVPERKYTDSGLIAGAYCYKVTATYNNLESLPSNLSELIVPLVAPGDLRITLNAPFVATNLQVQPK